MAAERGRPTKGLVFRDLGYRVCRKDRPHGGGEPYVLQVAVAAERGRPTKGLVFRDLGYRICRKDRPHGGGDPCVQQGARQTIGLADLGFRV